MMDEDSPVCVLSKWTDGICGLTGLQRARDVKGAYIALIQTLLIFGEPQQSIGLLSSATNLQILVPTCGNGQGHQCCNGQTNQTT